MVRVSEACSREIMEILSSPLMQDYMNGTGNQKK